MRAQLRGIAPLTLKPEVVIANLEEGSDVPAALAAVGAVGVFASIEAETAEMDADEARALLEEFGVDEPGLGEGDRGVLPGDRPHHVPDDRRGRDARVGGPPRRRGARGVRRDPHDLQRGFIRAEVIGYDELVAAGSMEAAKAAGKIRVEGKDYVVREGDILHVRFNV